MFYSRHFRSARVAISEDRGWRLRAPNSSVHKARCLFMRTVPTGEPGPRGGKERTGSGAGSKSGAGTETITGSGAVEARRRSARNRIKIVDAIRHFHCARVIISEDRGWCLRAPHSYVRKDRCLYTRIASRG